MAAQNILIERDRTFEIADTKHDMVEPGEPHCGLGARSSSGLDGSCVRHCRFLSLTIDHSTAKSSKPAVGLLLGGLVRLYPGAARMLASPGAHLGAVENAVVVGVRLVKSRPGAPAGPFLGALHGLLAGDAVAHRG